MVNVILPCGRVEYGNKQNDVRPQEAAVRVLFGRAPWLWQQYALLRAEQCARFEADHPDDFNEIDWNDFGREAFMEWVDGPPQPEHVPDADWREHLATLPPRKYNAAFGAYFHAFDDEPGVQEALLVCVLEPFAALELITGGEDDDGWDFDEEPLSCYNYVSVIGSGCLIANVIAFVQIALPSVLLWATWSDVRESEGGDRVPLCRGDGAAPNRLAILCVTLIYATTVVP
jgi:hypothetical protein